MQCVEGVEELFLRAFLLRQKLDVIHQEHIDVAELVAKAGHLVVTQRVDHLVGELFTGDVTDGRLWLTPPDLVPDGLHQVGLAHSDAAVQEERVVGLGRTLCHGLARRVRELIAAADHEGIKRVARIQLCCSVPIEPSLGRMSG